MGKYSFGKEEKLKKEKYIKELFEKGSSFYLFPFKVLFLPLPDQQQAPFHQILISVSKRSFKRAVDRNAIKRRVRESYRLNKTVISALPVKHAIGFIYTHKEILHSEEMLKKMVQALNKFRQLTSS